MSKLIQNRISTALSTAGSNRWTRVRCSLVVVCVTLFFLVSIFVEKTTSQKTLQTAANEVVKPFQPTTTLTSHLVRVPKDSNLRGESIKILDNKYENLKEGLAAPSESDGTDDDKPKETRETQTEPVKAGGENLELTSKATNETPEGSTESAIEQAESKAVSTSEISRKESAIVVTPASQNEPTELETQSTSPTTPETTKEREEIDNARSGSIQVTKTPEQVAQDKSRKDDSKETPDENDPREPLDNTGKTNKDKPTPENYPTSDNKQFKEAPDGEGKATAKSDRKKPKETPDSVSSETGVSTNNETAEAPIPANDAVLDHFNYCQATHLGDPENGQAGVPIWYRCEGPKYDEFLEKLHPFAEKKAASHSPEWGRRASPLPADASVLFFGSQHTQQLALTLACQMGQEQVSDVHHFDYDLIDPNMAIRIRFRNGSSLYVVADSYVAYSENWQTLLEKQIEKPIREFDLVALGIFKVGNKGDSETVQNLKHLAETLPEDYGVDPIKNPNGVTPDDITAVYEGAFLLVSNSSPEGSKQYTGYRKKLRFNPRSDYTSLDQRQWMGKMHAEGAAGSRDEVQDVSDDSAGLRCVGAGGGHPDLSSWDVSDFLYRFVNK